MNITVCEMPGYYFSVSLIDGWTDKIMVQQWTHISRTDEWMDGQNDGWAMNSHLFKCIVSQCHHKSARNLWRI